MVSKKIIKKNPTKSLKHRRYKHCSPVKSITSTASSAVIKSIYTCQRRLVKLFTKLARITGTPTPKKRKGFQLLTKYNEDNDDNGNINSNVVPRMLFYEEPCCRTRLSPMSGSKKATVFLDLDETLVHSKADPPPEKWDFIVRPRIDGRIVSFYVLKRPGVDEFLRVLKGKFEVVVFTAGLREYASLVLDKLDVDGVIDHRLYRDACREVEGGKYVKDLRAVGNGRDMRRVVIVDDNPGSYECNPENAVPVKPFVDDLEDCELGKLSVFFDGCVGDGDGDMRVAVKEYLASC